MTGTVLIPSVPSDEHRASVEITARPNEYQLARGHRRERAAEGTTVDADASVVLYGSPWSETERQQSPAARRTRPAPGCQDLDQLTRRGPSCVRTANLSASHRRPPAAECRQRSPQYACQLGCRASLPRRDGAAGGAVTASSARYFLTVRQSQPTSAAIWAYVAPASRSALNLLMFIQDSASRIMEQDTLRS
jgi:hypothetical protein